MSSTGASVGRVTALSVWALVVVLYMADAALALGPAIGRREILQQGGGALAIASAVDPTAMGAPVSGLSNPKGYDDGDELRQLFRTLYPPKSKRGKPTPSSSSSPQPRTILWSPPSEEFSGLRYGSSSLSAKEPVVPKPSRDALPDLPSWMAGHWLVTYRFDGVSFPNGRDRISLALPGTGLGTCAMLPNVGANPSPFVQRFGNGRYPLGDDGDDEMTTTTGASADRGSPPVVVEDVAYNLPRRFEGFWPEAKVSSVAVRTSAATLGPACLATGEGCSPGANPGLHGRHATRCRMEYVGPTRRSGRLAQHLDVSMVDWTSTPTGGGSSNGTGNDDDHEFLMARSFVQYNQEQELTGYYREFVSYDRQQQEQQTTKPPTGTVRGRTCVAAFLPSFEQPVALYKYTLKMDAISGYEATMY